MRGHLNTDDQARDRTRNFLLLGLMELDFSGSLHISVANRREFTIASAYVIKVLKDSSPNAFP